MFRFFAPASRRPLWLAALLPLALAACDNDDDQVLPTVLPAQVTFTQAGLYPEGSQYDSQARRFVVSSQTAGRLGQVDDQGTYSQYVDDARLVSTIGLNYDAGRSRLLVAVSDPGYNQSRTTAATKGKLAALAVVSGSPATVSQYVSLGSLTGSTYAGHFANDIAVDNQGNAYVTDSFAPLIYKVTPQGTATVFLENAALAAPAGQFGLNGIVYHPDGYLLVAKSDAGAVFKVPLAAPASFTRVSATGLNLSGIDGMQLYDNNTLVVACNAQGQVYRLGSTDGFGSVSQTGSFATGAVYPTTLPRRDAATYVLYSHLDALQRMQTPPVSDFALTQVRF